MHLKVQSSNNIYAVYILGVKQYCGVLIWKGTKNAIHNFQQLLWRAVCAMRSRTAQSVALYHRLLCHGFTDSGDFIQALSPSAVWYVSTAKMSQQTYLTKSMKTYKQL